MTVFDNIYRCTLTVVSVLFWLIVPIRSNRHARRPPRRHESPLEPYPGHSVSLAARGSRPNDRSAWASRHDPRRDRPRSLRSRAAARPRPPARGSARPCQGLRRQGDAGHSHHFRFDRATRRRQVAAAYPGLGATLASALRSHVLSRLRGVRAGRSARQNARGAVERSLGGRIVGVIARDATEIEAREKPAAKEASDKKDDPPSDGAQPPRKRGRPRKDERRPKPEPTRLERQTSQNVNQMLAELPTACDVGSKKNSKGYKETWIGYKLHIDVACGQIPVSCVLTSASVHDSQVAIPLMTMTGARVSYLYDLMDAAYDAAAIHHHSRTLGHAPIIDRNFRAQHEVKAEWEREADRMKFIHMPDADDVIYDFRTMVERVNARLKDEFGARFLRVRGSIKVKCYLMFGIVALAADQILRVASFRPAPA